MFDIVWSNQWEPATKTQHASDVYRNKFPHTPHSNEDIAAVPTETIPEFDMLVGWFPCQDYSVAKTLTHSKWIIWKKWVLWWEIHRIIKESKHKPKYLLLENVDRLLKSPVKQRWRDFAIMLASLSDLWYIVEWRVINAADYWMPQRRRRVFFMAYHESTEIYKTIIKKYSKNPLEWIAKDGLIAQEFSVDSHSDFEVILDIAWDLETISDAFNKEWHSSSPFQNSWIMIGRSATTAKVIPKFSGKPINLGDVLLDEKDVPEEYFIKESDLHKWETQKKWKKEKRINKATWFEYFYSEWDMLFPDALDKPSRTIITWEGWSSASRFKHVIRTMSWRMRRLTPIELERLNMFPDNHTEWTWDVKRAFFMWNALVVWVIEKLGKALARNV